MVAFQIVRDFKVWWSYKMWLTLDITGTMLFIATYYLVSHIISGQHVADAGYITGGYFTFAVVGIAFQQYVFSSVMGISESIRDEQWMGTLETILSSATSFRTFLLGESIFFFIVGSSFLAGSLATGLALGAEFRLEPLALLSVMVLSVLLIASHMAVGILGAGIIMKTKQGNPLVWAFSWMTQLVSGVFYPLGLLPWYLEWVGKIFPLTYSLDGIRLCLQGGQTLISPTVLNDVASLLIFIAVTLPLSLYIFKLGYNSARREGSLSQY
ncbi:MAG: ABC transporter permease [Candidatus Bathyarchaeia archaeon]